MTSSQPTPPHPDPAAAADGGDRAERVKLCKLSPRQQLLAWINHHFAAASARQVANFTSDWKDGKTLAALVSSMAPGHANCTVKISVYTYNGTGSVYV